MILALFGGLLLCLLAALVVRLVNDLATPSPLNTWIVELFGGKHG